MRYAFFALLALLLIAPLAQAQTPLATSDITVRGLDDVLQSLNAMKDKRYIGQTSLVLTLLKGFGRPSKAEDGRNQLDYQIKLEQDGKLLVNGIDIVSLLEGTVKKN